MLIVIYNVYILSKGRQKIPLSFVAILFTTLSTKKQLEVKSSTIFGELSNVCVVLVLDSALFRSITVLCHGVIWIAKKTALLSKSVYQRTRSTVGSERHYCFHWCTSWYPTKRCFSHLLLSLPILHKCYSSDEYVVFLSGKADESKFCPTSKFSSWTRVFW